MEEKSLRKKILVLGGGYVGSSNALLLSIKHDVILIDPDDEKTRKINNKESPIDDNLMDEFFKNTNISLRAKKSIDENTINCDYLLIALPTDFDETTNFFDTSVIDDTVALLDNHALKAPIIIRSTVPVGYTRELQDKYPNLHFVFVPEFLREGRALQDSLHPSRVIIGSDSRNADEIEKLFTNVIKNSPLVLHMQTSEAEAAKLFANSYLANRVSFFNEVDSFCLEKNLDTKSVICGISSDSRIGSDYNNPSFGYGGYCLPKDTKQLRANFGEIPQKLFDAIISSNNLRKKFLLNKILDIDSEIIGVFRLTMKKDSQNFRESPILDLMNLLIGSGKKIIIYEPLLKDNSVEFEICNDFEEFADKCDLIIANRFDEMLKNVKHKLFTRDIFGTN